MHIVYFVDDLRLVGASGQHDALAAGMTGLTSLLDQMGARYHAKALKGGEVMKMIFPGAKQNENGHSRTKQNENDLSQTTKNMKMALPGAEQNKMKIAFPGRSKMEMTLPSPRKWKWHSRNTC